MATALFARQGFFQLCTRMVEERHTDVYLQQIGCAFVGAAATYGACSCRAAALPTLVSPRPAAAHLYSTVVDDAP